MLSLTMANATVQPYRKLFSGQATKFYILPPRYDYRQENSYVLSPVVQPRRQTLPVERARHPHLSLRQS